MVKVMCVTDVIATLIVTIQVVVEKIVCVTNIIATLMDTDDEIKSWWQKQWVSLTYCNTVGHKFYTVTKL